MSQHTLEDVGHFCCPQCLKKIPLGSDNITVEHIVPQSAGGKLETFLCKGCNSKNGTKISKHFAFFLNSLVDDGSPTRSNPYLGHFKGTLNGVERDFTIQEADDGAIEVRNLYENAQHMAAKPVPNRKGKFEFSITPATKEKARLAEIGLLAAGYLLIFKQFGYSWVLQSHLDDVRRALSNPEKSSVPSSMIFDTGTLEPSVGIIEFQGGYFPAASILGFGICFSSFSKQFPETSNEKPTKMFGRSVFDHLSQAASPMQSWTAGNEVVMYPDLANKIIKPEFRDFPIEKLE